MAQFELYTHINDGNYTLVPFAQKNALAAAAGVCHTIPCGDFEFTALRIFEEELAAFATRSWREKSELYELWSSQQRNAFLRSHIGFTVSQNSRLNRMFLYFPDGTSKIHWDLPLSQAIISEIHQTCQENRNA